jgi:DUF4097 and DUF4098 domain-containing protein YvlB
MKAFAALAVAVVVFGASASRAGAWPQQTQTDTKTYEVAGDAQIAVDATEADVTVRGWSADKVELVTKRSAWSSDDLSRLTTTVDAQSDHVSVSEDAPLRCDNCGISYELRVPAGAHVTISTASGDVDVRGIGGPVRVDASSGDVEIHQIGGQVFARTTSGDISVSDLASALEAYSSSGDIQAKDLTTDTALVTDSGSIEAYFDRFSSVHQVRMKSSSGDVSLTVPRGSGFAIDASTSSGSMDSNLQLPIAERDSGAAVHAQVGSGKTMVQLATSSGDIDVTMR